MTKRKVTFYVESVKTTETEKIGRTKAVYQKRKLNGSCLNQFQNRFDLLIDVSLGSNEKKPYRRSESHASRQSID